jgi:uncharacterized membrane-anchored protein/uncharacterized membrane protein
MMKQTLPETVRRWLSEALPTWQQQGLLGPEQANSILALYEDEASVQARRGSLVSFTLYALGACLFGLAALLVIGFNWDAIPRVAKLGTVLAVISATHGLALWVRRTSPTASEIGFFLGCLFYGAGIWLIGQAFHLDAHYPDGVFWWAVGVLAFALVLDSLLLHTLFVALMAMWAGMEMLSFAHLRPWWSAGFLPNGAWALPVLAAPGLLWAYRRCSPWAVGLYVALLVWWVVLQAFVWRFGHSSLALSWIGGVGALLMLAAEAHRFGNRLGTPYRVWGALLSAGSLIPMSSWQYWRYFGRANYWNQPTLDYFYQLVVPGIAFGLLTLVGVGLCFRASNRRAMVPVGVLGLMIGLAMWNLLLANDWSGAVVAVSLGNVAMLALSLYLIQVGAREERLRPFVAGVLYFLVWAIARYVDLFNMVGGMLGTAAIFVLCGIAIVVVGRFWSQLKRRESMDSQEVTSGWSEPVWFTNLVGWTRERTRPILYGAVGFQLLFLVEMIAIESAPLVFGKTILLRVQPVDPRDFFRGDYVILRYDIHNMTPPADYEHGAPVYVAIEPEDDGRHWRGVTASSARPTTGDYLVGRSNSTRWGWPQVQFGIEAFYVQEGKGLAWEEAARHGNLTAEIAVAPWGQAKLRRLLVDR